jgi:heme-degrading monooxygenase HmoA
MPVLAKRPVHADILLHHRPASSRHSQAATIMIHQLRIYEIFERNKAAFHARFRDHAARIMRKYGFQIAAMWETRSGEKTQFVYLLEWPDEAAKTAAWSAFMSDAEWAGIKRVTAAEHGQLVGAIEDRVLNPLDYSPAAGRSLISAPAC